MNFSEFLAWEASTRDTIDFKKIYVDMVGDLNAGLMLSEIVYWYLPGTRGTNKLRVEHEGKQWIAVRRYEWWERTRMSPKQADRALSVLLSVVLVEKKLFKFTGEVALHVRLIEDAFLKIFEDALAHPAQNPYRGENGFSPKGKSDIPQRSKSKLPKGKKRHSAKGNIGVSRKGKSLFRKSENPITKTTTSITSETTSETTTTTTDVVVVDETDQRHWDACFHQLEMQLDRQSFETFLRGAWLQGVERETGGVTFVIGVRNTYAQTMLQHRLYRNVARILSDVSGTKCALRFEVAAAPTEPDEDQAVPLFRLLARQNSDPSSNTETETLRQLCARFIGNALDEDVLCRLETTYSVEDFGHALTIMADKQAQGLVSDPLSYTLGILRNQKATAR